MMANTEVIEGYRNRFKKMLFGLLCEYEKNGKWEDFLDTILIEMRGIPKEERTINYLSIYFILSGLKYNRYEYFRKSIFDCMTLVSKGGDNGIL